MNCDEVMQELEAFGSEQTRKTYRRHGATGPMFGVNYSDLYKLRKRIKRDHALAQALWATRNEDARVLALMVADPLQADDALLDGWLEDLDNYGLADALSGYVAETPLARAKMEQWMEAEREWTGQVGWNLLAHLALKDAALPAEFFAPFLDTIAGSIHTRPNRVRYSMNSALIAIGRRNPTLELRALAVAQSIGPVQVDHGDTSCKTPDAAAYITKTKARKSRV